MENGLIIYKTLYKNEEEEAKISYWREEGCTLTGTHVHMHGGALCFLNDSISVEKGYLKSRIFNKDVIFYIYRVNS